MNANTSAELWERIAPELLRQMVEIFANSGRGVSIAPVPEEQLTEREENEK